MSSMFYWCNKLTIIDVSNFNTSKVTDMSSMFSNCHNLTSLDISNFDTSKVTDMSGMFSRCSGLTSLDLNKFDTSNVTRMDAMFLSVPTTIQITTNSTMKTWLETNFADWAKNITTI